MKKLLITVALAVVVCVQLNAQGTVDFRNRITGTLDVPVYLNNAHTTLLAGPDFVAQLYFSATQGGSYTAVGAAPAPFRTGAGAGYWSAGADSTRILTGITAGAEAWIQVRAWNLTLDATYEAAVAAGNIATHPYGSSTPFRIPITGGGGVPPGSPAFMTGLTSFAVPEPSTIALGVLGLAGLLFIRRRK
jgi:hypothetical protein